MRKIKIAAGEYYHIYGRGNNKQDIFYDTGDNARFLLLILCLQSPLAFDNIHRMVSSLVRSSVSNMPLEKSIIDMIVSKRYVELVSFALMPNHFHLLVRGITDTGISEYMQRTLTGYTKYSNTKYEKSGHVFQGPFQIVPVKSNVQLLHLSAYIHRNPRELGEWYGREHEYPWSSYKDYFGNNRWGKLLEREIILNQFDKAGAYHEFLETSGTKEFEDLIDPNLSLGWLPSDSDAKK